MFQCKICNYFSNRKYNLQRHYDNKHTKQVENNENTQNEQNVSPNIQNDIPKIQNDIPKIQNDISKTQNDIPSEVKVFICKTCNKIYKTKRHLLNHEKRCQKVDNLTCPKCMASFTHRNNKNRHIKENKCVARSIVHARRPYIQNITNNTNNTNNTINNIQNTNITNHNQIIINNIGSERVDHITHNDILKILTSGENTIPLYIQKKHFDEEFPENNNIQYTIENKCKIFENDAWKEKDIGSLSSELIQDNTEVLLLYCDDNQLKILEDIKHEEKYKFIKDKLLIIYSKSDNSKYLKILKKIKDLIKNSKQM
jgi:hypothetical protein